MDIQRIEFPKELLNHNLSDQELAMIPADKLAIAKDWNVIKRQNEWMMREIVYGREIMIFQDSRLKVLTDQLEFWNRIRWGVVLLLGSIVTVLTILKTAGVIK